MSTCNCLNRTLSAHLPVGLLKFLVAGLPFGLFQVLSLDSSDVERTKAICRTARLFPNLTFYPLIHVAACCSYESMLRNMLSAGELYSVDNDGNTPLFYAIVFENADCVGVIF